MSHSLESPLTGHCLCGGVRIEVTAPFAGSGYCHCTHCQRRTSTNGFTTVDTIIP